MLLKLRKRVATRLTGERESGFTLVELLVVMLILGLLAAIAIPSFFNQRDKAKDAEAKAAARTAQTAIETYATDNNGSYAGATPSKLIAIEQSLNDVASRLTVPSPTVDSYTVTVASTNNNPAHTFSITRSSTGVTTQTCTPVTTDGDDGCPGGGNWGGS